MESWIVWSGIALGLFIIWTLARHDWLRLTRPSRRVVARVSGHRESVEDGSTAYAAQVTFTDATGVHEVTDSVSWSSPRPEVGALRELRYPAGYPKLARPPRFLRWVLVYAMLLALIGLLIAKATGQLDHGDSAYPDREIPG